MRGVGVCAAVSGGQTGRYGAVGASPPRSVAPITAMHPSPLITHPSPLITHPPPLITPQPPQPPPPPPVLKASDCGYLTSNVDIAVSWGLRHAAEAQAEMRRLAETRGGDGAGAGAGLPLVGDDPHRVQRRHIRRVEPLLSAFAEIGEGRGGGGGGVGVSGGLRWMFEQLPSQPKAAQPVWRSPSLLLSPSLARPRHI